MKTPKPAPVQIDSQDVWNAAAAAYRINNGYFRVNDPSGKTPGIPLQTNVQLMQDVVLKKFDVSDVDRDFGERLRAHYQGLLLKQIGGGKLNEYELSILKFANCESFLNTDRYAFAVIASSVSSFERAQTREQKRETINGLLTASKYLGPIGSKVSGLEITVLQVAFSTKYLINFITAVTSDGNVIFFAHKRSFEDGEKLKIKGTIKAHRDSNQTQLNRVSIIE
jgi:hypothetical protein